MADQFTIRPTDPAAPVQAQQINASVGTGIASRVSDGRITNQAQAAQMGPNPLGYLFDIGKGLLEPVIKQQEQAKYLEGMARAVAGETADDINHERPTWARAFGDSQAVAGARAYEGATDATRLESALYSAMPDLIKRDGGEVAREAAKIAGKMQTGDPVRDQAINASVPQILPNILRMHATGRAKWLQDEAARVDTGNKVGQIKAFYAAEEALRNTPALDSTDGQVLARNNRNLVDTMMTPGPGQDERQFLARSAGALMADVAAGNFAATYTLLDNGFLDRIEATNPGTGPKLMEALRKAERKKLDASAYVTNPGLAVNMARLAVGTLGDVEATEQVVSEINAKVQAGAGVRYEKFIDGDKEAQFLQAAERTRVREENEAVREAKAAQREADRERRQAARDARRDARADLKELTAALKEQSEQGVLDGYEAALNAAAGSAPGTDQGNTRVVTGSMRDLIKEFKIKERVADHVEYRALVRALDQGPGAVANVMSALQGGAAPQKFKDALASGIRTGNADTLDAVGAYAKMRSNPNLVAKIWTTAEEARGMEEAYQRVVQSGQEAALQPLPPGAPPEVEKQYIQTREKVAGTMNLLAQERKARDGLGRDLASVIQGGKEKATQAEAATRDLIKETYGGNLSGVAKATLNRLVANRVKDAMPIPGVQPAQMVKDAWAHVQDAVLPLGTKMVALPLPGTPTVSTLGLSGLKNRSSDVWDKALLAALKEKGGGADYKLEDIKEAYYGQGERGANLILHVYSEGKLHSWNIPEFDIRKHVKE